MTPRRSGRQKTFKHTPRRSNKLPLAVALLIIVGVIAVVIFAFSMNKINSPSSPNSPAGDKVLLQTSLGDITIQLRDDKPKTTGNFKTLVQQGFYDATIFHRVIADFMIQGGQNPDIAVATIPDEIGNDNHNYRGTIAMAKTSQPNSATSQFFINVVNNNEKVYQDGTTFDGTYTVFGTVISGMNVVDDISNVATQNEKPITDVIIIRAEIIT